MYKVYAIFDKDGNRCDTYMCDSMPYTEKDIKEKFPEAIEVSYDDWIKYSKFSGGLYKRNMKTGKPELKKIKEAEKN